MANTIDFMRDANTISFNRSPRRAEPRQPSDCDPQAVAIRRSIEEHQEQKRLAAEWEL